MDFAAAAVHVIIAIAAVADHANDDAAVGFVVAVLHRHLVLARESVHDHLAVNREANAHRFEFL